MKRFWMVKGPGPASVIHDNERDAEAEAERLALFHPGDQFFVMESVTAIRKLEVERIDLTGDEWEAPF